MKMHKFITAALTVSAIYCFAQEAEEAVAEVAEVAAEEVVAVAEVIAEEVVAVAEVAEVIAEEVVAEVAEVIAEEVVAEVAEVVAEVAEVIAEEVAEVIAEEVAEEVAETAEEEEALDMCCLSDCVKITVGFDIASGNLSDDGYALSKNMVANPEIEITAGLTDCVSLFAGMWMNYNINKGKYNGSTKNSGNVETDLWAGLTADIAEGLSLSGSFVTWQYHNTPDCSTDNLLLFDLNFEYGDFEAGLMYEYMVSGDSKKDMAFRPYAQYGVTLCEDYDVGVEVRVMPSFYVQDEGPDAWTACILSAKITCGPFYVFGKYYGKMQSKIENDLDDVNTVYGVGCKFEF